MLEIFQGRVWRGAGPRCLMGARGRRLAGLRGNGRVKTNRANDGLRWLVIFARGACGFFWITQMSSGLSSCEGLGQPTSGGSFLSSPCERPVELMLSERVLGAPSYTKGVCTVHVKKISNPTPPQEKIGTTFASQKKKKSQWPGE